MSSNDDFVFFGTPLEELDQDEIPRKKYQPDLTVRDAQGRRRFHGAFTGGFSAGFYNTVGTKEGWTPSSFKSSKSSKAEGATRRPQDYMDEEDTGEFGIAPQRIQVKEDFADFSERRKRTRDPARGHGGPIPGSPPLKNIFKPANMTIGVKLLSHMGWRQGQGIGPRISMKEKRQKDKLGHKVYGCSLPPGLRSSSSSEDDEYAETFTFAPSDVKEVDYTPKTNKHGIGYVSLGVHSIFEAPVDMDRPTTAKAHLEKGKRKLTITGQAFGVGAFEDDDADIYAREDMSQYNFFLSEEPKPAAKKNEVEHKRGGRQSTLHQVRKDLEGFHLATDKGQSQRKLYLPPEIPADFEPIHQTGKRERRRFEEPKDQLYKEKKVEHTGSVFDLLSPEDKERIELAKQGKAFVPKVDSTMHKKSEGSTTLGRVSADVLNVSESAAAERVGTVEVTKPFARNEAKQRRFEQYLSLLSSNRAELYAAMQPMLMTEWEKEKERKEFERAAMICQPAKSLNSRFVSKNTLADDDSAVDVPIDKLEENDDKSKAAEMGMFGRLTHEDFEWHPADLLCKRFNVPNPYPGCEIVGMAVVKVDKRSIFNFLNDPEAGAGKTETSSDADGIMESDKPSTSLAELFSKKVEAKPSSTTESEDEDMEIKVDQERPPLAFFKAIFSEESSSDEDEPGVKPSTPQTAVVDQRTTSEVKETLVPEEKKNFPVAVEKSNKARPAAKGVFANLDFDRLNALPPPVSVEELQRNVQSDSAATTKAGEGKCNEDGESNMYGPRLPPPGTVSQQVLEPVRIRHKHKKKEHRKSGKAKHRKHKSKPKNKKHKKHSKKHAIKSRPANGSGSSTDEDTDSEDSSDAEMLNRLTQVIQKFA